MELNSQQQTEQGVLHSLCGIEAGIVSAIAAIDHVACNLNEGMSISVQVAVLRGAVSLLECQLGELDKMCVTHANHTKGAN
jgi:hypothetical protein